MKMLLLLSRKSSSQNNNNNKKKLEKFIVSISLACQLGLVVGEKLPKQESKTNENEIKIEQKFTYLHRSVLLIFLFIE